MQAFTCLPRSEKDPDLTHMSEASSHALPPDSSLPPLSSAWRAGGDMYTVLKTMPSVLAWDRLGARIALDVALGGSLQQPSITSQTSHTRACNSPRSHHRPHTHHPWWLASLLHLQHSAAPAVQGGHSSLLCMVALAAVP